jgi:signal transduction histidine kinase
MARASLLSRHALRNWTPSIYLKLMVPFSVVLLVTAAIAWWLTTRMFSIALEERVNEQLTNVATVLAKGNLPLTDDLVFKVRQLLETEIVLIQRDGYIAMSTWGNGRDEAHRQISKIFAQCPQESGCIRPMPMQLPSGLYSVVLRLVPAGRDSRYRAVAVLSSLADVQSATRNAAVWIGAATLLGGMLIAWAGQRIAAGIINPLRDLARMAERLAGGDRDVRVESRRSDEIGELMGALNTMAEKLQSFEQALSRRTRLEALGEMSARIAHEVRNPLTAIKLQLQLMQENVDEAQAEPIRQTLDEIRRLELVVSGALDFGRSRSLDPVEVDLNDLVDDVRRLFGPQLQHRAISIECRLDASLPQVRLDADRIKQVLLNLLVNAAEAMTTGGLIRIGTCRTGSDHVSLTVEDSGSGIDPSRMDLIFTPLHTDKKGGFGLGLPISKELVELHGGTIEISRSDLGGARFAVLLPIESIR